MPKIYCPTCNQSYDVDNSLIGQKANCQSCGTDFIIRIDDAPLPERKFVSQPPQAPHPQAPHPQAPHPQAPHPQAPHPQAPHPTTKQCPMCKETISFDAKKCRYCQEYIADANGSKPIDRVSYTIIACLFGWLGFHNFAENRDNRGIIHIALFIAIPFLLGAAGSSRNVEARITFLTIAIGCAAVKLYMICRDIIRGPKNY